MLATEFVIPLLDWSFEIPGRYWGYVVPGYAIAIVSILAYARFVLQRSRSLAAKVPVEKRRYFSDRSD